MGLSASQARLLNLTARMHDIEYKAQNLEAQKLQMANESSHVYQEYENALNKTKVQYKKIQNDGSSGFEDATFTKLGALGYKFKVIDKTTGEFTTDAKSASEACAAAGVTDSNATLSSMVEAGFVIFVKDEKDSSGNVLTDADGNNITIEMNIATDTGLQQVSDELDLKKAEAKYEADMRKINQKDKKFDTDLAALEAERNAIKTEMETLKSIAKDNVDRTYKLFS